MEGLTPKIHITTMLSKASIIDFFQMEQERMVGFVRKFIESISEFDAEDIVQDIALNLFNRPKMATPIENISAYVYRALKNRIIDYYRKKKNTISLDDRVTGSHDLSLGDIVRETKYDTASEIKKMEIAQELYGILNMLKEDERAIIIATEIEGKPYHYLAKKWNIPINTLLSKKSRALKKLKKRYNREISRNRF